MPGGPAADLVLIQPGEILGGLEGFFDAPALPGDADRGAQREGACAVPAQVGQLAGAVVAPDQQIMAAGVGVVLGQQRDPGPRVEALTLAARSGRMLLPCPPRRLVELARTLGSPALGKADRGPVAGRRRPPRRSRAGHHEPRRRPSRPSQAGAAAGRCQVTAMLGDRPAVLAIQARKHPQHQPGGMPQRLVPSETWRDPVDHRAERCRPTIRVYAMRRGHRIILVIPHSSSA